MHLYLKSCIDFADRVNDIFKVYNANLVFNKVQEAQISAAYRPIWVSPYLILFIFYFSAELLFYLTL